MRRPTRPLKEQNKPLRHLFLHARGALLVRAGRSEEAVKAAREGMTSTPMAASSRTGCSSHLPSTGSPTDAAKQAASKAGARSKSKPTAVWEKAEIELLAAELDAVLPPAAR